MADNYDLSKLLRKTHIRPRHCDCTTPDGTKLSLPISLWVAAQTAAIVSLRSRGGITIYPFDASKVEDPSLIIYSPVRLLDNKLIVTNGDQTDPSMISCRGKCFASALETRTFERMRPTIRRVSAEYCILMMRLLSDSI
jgi:hypothetical protein